MLCDKLLVLFLYLTVMDTKVATFDYPDVTGNAAESKMLHHQNQSPQNGDGNFVVDLFVKYAYIWAVYLTQLTSNFGEVVSGMMFHLQDKVSSFPLTAVQTFCVTSIFLLFFAVSVMLKRMGRQLDRVAALERENASLRESSKMNRVLLNELAAENKETALNDLKDAIQAIEKRQTLYSEYRITVDTALYNLKQDMAKLNSQLQELDRRYTENKASLGNLSQNRDKVILDSYQYQDCQQNSSYLCYNANSQNQGYQKIQSQYDDKQNEQYLYHNYNESGDQVTDGVEHSCQNQNCQETTKQFIYSHQYGSSQTQHHQPTDSFHKPGLDAAHNLAANCNESCQSNNQNDDDVSVLNSGSSVQYKFVNHKESVCMQKEDVSKSSGYQTSQEDTPDQLGHDLNEHYYDQSLQSNSPLTSDKLNDQTKIDQGMISYEELVWYINELIYSCNTSYVQINGLQESHKDLFRFVDTHFGKIYEQLGYLAACQKKSADRSVSQEDSYV